MARVNCPVAAPQSEKRRRDTGKVAPQFFGALGTPLLFPTVRAAFSGGQRYDSTSVTDSTCPKGQVPWSAACGRFLTKRRVTRPYGVILRGVPFAARRISADTLSKILGLGSFGDPRRIASG